MAFYRTKGFRALNQSWRKRLTLSGFIDCEDEKGNLKRPDHRTQAFLSPEETQSFFRLLDDYLHDHPEMPEMHRKVMTLYSEGVYQKEIGERVKRSRTTIQTIVYLYRRILIR